MAAGEAEPELPPPPPPGGPATERALEEAAASGSLSLAGRRLRLFPDGAARRWDLSDTTQADLSRNRFAEVPEDACHLVSLEGLSLYHNCLRSIPPAIANLQSLTYLNLSRNQLTSLPPCLCRLPLKVLVATNNKLASLPDEMGSLSNLRQLDVSCNELQALPASMGQLESLRDLNLRRNQLTALPEELSELPLVRLDFSCNRVTRIPVCYRHLRHLQTILLDNNPLQSPPAQICLKGKIHIFKYLNLEACSKTGPDLADFTRPTRPTGFGTCLSDEFYPGRQYGGLDSGFNSVDSGSKRWSGNESTDEFSDLSFRIAELVRDPRQLKEKRDRAANGELEQIDFIDTSVEEEEAAKLESSSQAVAPAEEKRRAERSLPQRADVGEKVPNSRPNPPQEEPPSEERRRPETLQIWQERERQQQALRSQALEKRDSLLRMGPKGSFGSAQGPAASNGLSESSSLPQRKPRTQVTAEPPGVLSPASPGQMPRQQESLPPQVSSPLAREAGSAQKPSSFLFRSSSRTAIKPGSACTPHDPTADPQHPLRLRASSHDLDEKELTVQLRKAIESRLSVTLAEDLGDALANGAVLCQLVNHLRPRSVPFIHVPSPAVPKLNKVKCRKNVESFLEACRRMGVPEVALCSASDVLQGDAGRLRGTLRALLHPGAAEESPAAAHAAPALPGPLAGFALFYVSVMSLLFLAYCKLWGF
ncbi:LOW QUALITY PROTEIN: leucine-rich repeat and calponin homology domain-containing protein 4 [Gopherus flavomarginatus]|uniref:LOW QUALITY PROTEIN: leucine-rich repeat and calponin homology domain-containing protein 4 n=1 Tax=Gopherus flavomarginatus TaxID=286002 RepID=UPI0021CBA3D5|nr:LOW QUALITY PROTEIN: leucine-rich repeat and calponin homology domain-containing protein 4 [Gopherus flavomarginatus]